MPQKTVGETVGFWRKIEHQADCVALALAV
jgi:hypothetical protein